MSDLMLDVDQAGELKAAFRRGGYNNAEIKQLSSGDMLAKVRDVLRGTAEIKPIEHTVDLSADPFLPDGWKVEEHKKGKVSKVERRGDDLYLDGKKISLFLSEKQKYRSINGNDLHKELAKISVINVNLADYLLKNPHLIPEAWKNNEKGNTRYIFFWGTVYRFTDDFLYVRCLCWRGNKWDWSFYWLSSSWHSLDPTAVSAS